MNQTMDEILEGSQKGEMEQDEFQVFSSSENEKDEYEIGDRDENCIFSSDNDDQRRKRPTNLGEEDDDVSIFASIQKLLDQQDNIYTTEYAEIDINAQCDLSKRSEHVNHNNTREKENENVITVGNSSNTVKTPQSHRALSSNESLLSPEPKVQNHHCFDDSSIYTQQANGIYDTRNQYSETEKITRTQTKSDYINRNKRTFHQSVSSFTRKDYVQKNTENMHSAGEIRSQHGKDENFNASTEKVTSLAVSRPTHWGAATTSNSAADKRAPTMSSLNRTPAGKLGTSSFAQELKGTKRKLNRDNLRKMKNMALPRALTSNKTDSSPSESNSRKLIFPSQLSRSPAVAKNGQRAKSCSTPSTKKWEENVNLRQINFTPVFFNHKIRERINSQPHEDSCNLNEKATLDTTISRATIKGATEDTTKLSHSLGNHDINKKFSHKSSLNVNYDDHGYNTPSCFSPRSKVVKRNNNFSGTLVTLLRGVCSSIKGDGVRLSYSNRNESSTRRIISRKDINNPRNRATVLMDVTILGDPIPFAFGIHHATVLGSLENVIHRLKKDNDTIALRKIKNNPTAGESGPIHDLDKSYCDLLHKPKKWICFNIETIHEHKVKQGSRLRLYDVITLPSTSETSLDTIIATRVCETFS